MPRRIVIAAVVLGAAGLALAPALGATALDTVQFRAAALVLVTLGFWALVVLPEFITALIFFLLFSTFGSVRQALLVLSNIPFAMIGGIFGLLVSGEYLSVPASVGFIALLGIAVLNGVVMVTYFNQLLARGMSLADVVVEGAKRRLRPVMMTASIAAFGLVPMLFASGPGSEVQRPLAIVVIGGLLSSTALTLVLLPILFRRYGLAPKAANLEKPRG